MVWLCRWALPLGFAARLCGEALPRRWSFVGTDVGTGGRTVQEIDTTRAPPARMYDYLLGGKDHFEADRAAIAGLMKTVPNARTGARENRAFLGRAVRYLVAEAGIRQFLDIGSGLPTANNVHEVAQAVAPESRVAYVDNDPIVMAHARALLTGQPEGRTAYIQADLHDPASILNHPSVRGTLDFGEPIALVLMA